MAKDNKFGTFGGVYTPSVLTILGVIMYLRLPWMVGNAGLTVSLAIIIVAHVISVSTGLSISSISTDKNVGAGGPYYIVSRSLGLPIGGTLGLALFVGLGFSISLYVIGFCESFLRFAGYEPSLANIRIAGGITLMGLTSIALISTAFAIKTQYLILSLIAASLVSVFFGSHEAPAEPLMSAAKNAPSLGEMFGIFFPAVTGFTAGVNMSGDLRKPKESIPKGTMLAIATGLVVYVSLAVFLAYRVPRELLIEDPTVLVEVAGVDWLVVGGIWGATLSSALGSILGAPRILQAISADGITPAFLAKGAGKSNEPRNALVVSLLIGASGVMIGELDVIARVVSMVFLTTYGFLNISCAIESWASPDFRPEFRIPKSVSLLGAVTCVVVMIQLDLAAMAGCVILMAVLYAWLARRQLQLESGDTWEGFWASLVRAGLYRLSRERQQHRNWRPNVLMFRESSKQTTELAAFAHSLVGGNGLLTDFKIDRRTHKPKRDDSTSDVANGDSPPRVGVFQRHLPTTDVYEDIAQVCRHYGFAGLVPNTVLLDGTALQDQPAALARLTALTHELDYNQLIYAGANVSTGDDRPQPERRIDVWWKQGYGNLALALAVLRFITSSKAHENASLRFMLVSDDSANNDILRTRVRRTLKEARVTAEIEVVNNLLESRGLVEWVRRQSSDAALAIVGLPDDPAASDEATFESWRELLETHAAVLLVRGSSTFQDELSVAPTVSRSLMPAARESERPVLDELKVADNPQIEGRVEDIGEAVQQAVLALHEHGVARLHAPQVGLLRSLRAAYERRASELEQRLRGENPRKQRKLLNRLHGNFLLEVRKLLEAALERDLPAQRDALEGRVETFLRDEGLLVAEPDAVLWIFADREQFAVSPDDPRALRRLKRRRRWVSFFKRSKPSYPTPIGVLEAAAREQLIKEVLADAVQRATSDCHQLVAHVAKRFNATDETLTLVRGLDVSEQDVAHILAEHRESTLRHFDELIATERALLESSRTRMLQASHDCVQLFADRLANLGTFAQRRRLRVDDKALGQREADLAEAAARWSVNQRALLERALLSLKVSAFQHRLTAIVSRERDALHLELQSGLGKELERFHAQLTALLEGLKGGEVTALDVPTLSFERRATFDPGPILERLQKEAEACAAELPDSVSTIDNDSIERLEEQGSGARVESVTLAIRSLVAFAVESELTGVLEEQLTALPQLEQRAVAVGHDVARLVAFQRDQFEGDEAGEDFASHMLPAVENGVERLASELEKVRGALERVLGVVEQRLDVLMRKTSVYELATASDTFDESRRRQRGRRAVTGAYGALVRVADSLRRGSVTLLYRMTAGVVLARKLRRRRTAGGHVVERVIAEVTEHSPQIEVLDALPYYYRQLFFGQATLNENFWTARGDEVAAAKTAIGHFRRGAKGCLIVQGERGSGKTALWQHIASQLLGRHAVHRVHAVAGGSARLADFERGLQEALGQPGSSRQLVAGLERGSVIVLDDFELWWERTATGMVVVDQVLDLIDRFGDRCLFVLCMGQQAYEFIARLRPLSDRALGVIECGPVSAETLKDVVTLRHESTGLSYELNGRAERTLSQWAVARLFAAHFQYCRGLIGVAQQSWVTHISHCEKQRLRIRRPRTVRAHSFDELPMAHTTLLLQLCLHKQLHEERMNRLHPGAADANRQLLASLIRMGLVSEPRPHVYEVNRFIQHLLVQSLRERGLLV